MDVEELRLTLNAQQFKYLLDPQSFLLLSHFTESKSPSDVAKEMNMPANVIHYRVKRAVKLGLLVIAERQGRRHCFRLAAEKFRVPLDLLPLISEVTPHMLKRALTKIHKGFSQELSQVQNTLYESAYDVDGERFVDLDIQNSVLAKAFFPVIQLLEIRLQPAHYVNLVEILTRGLTEAQEKVNSEGQLCTFVIIAYQGSISKQGVAQERKQ
jgi:hypothetical protein